MVALLVILAVLEVDVGENKDRSSPGADGRHTHSCVVAADHGVCPSCPCPGKECLRGPPCSAVCWPGEETR